MNSKHKNMKNGVLTTIPAFEEVEEDAGKEVAEQTGRRRRQTIPQRMREENGGGPWFRRGKDRRVSGESGRVE